MLLKNFFDILFALISLILESFFLSSNLIPVSTLHLTLFLLLVVLSLLLVAARSL
jgi:hypothetical protein